MAVGYEVDERVTSAAPTLGHALGVVAGTAVDQARDLVVAQLDRLAERLRERLEVAAEEPSPAVHVVADVAAKPLLVGALAGVAVAWLLASRASKA